MADTKDNLLSGLISMLNSEGINLNEITEIEFNGGLLWFKVGSIQYCISLEIL